MNVELPDGTVIQDIPEGTTKAQLAERLQANGMKVPKEWMAPKLNPEQQAQESSKAELRRKAGVGEAVLNTATGALAGPISGYAGLLGAALPGPEGQGAKWQQATQRALTYEPRTEHGRSVANAIGYLPQKLMEVGNAGGEAVTDATGSPALGAATATGINMLPALVSRGARPLVDSSIAKVSKAASRNAVNDATLETAQKEGYIVPSDTLVGKTATSVGGKAATTQEASLHNAEVTDKIARREASLREDEPITPQALKQARDVLSEPYRRVTALSPVAEKALKKLQVAREDAQAYWREYDGPNHPVAARDKARALDKTADGLESVIDMEAKRLKQPDLLQDLQVARKKLAKNYQVEGALNKGDGHVDAGYIGRRYDAGAYMTDGLETIARFAQGPGRKVSREASAVGVPGAGHLQAWGSLLGALEGYHAGGIPGAVVGGLAMPAAVGIGRAVALSKFAQPKGGTGPGLGLKIMDVGTRPVATGAAALTPSLGLQPPREEY